jgi:hypothetical protein
MANQLQNAVVNSLKAARPDVTFTVTEIGPAKADYSNGHLHTKNVIFVDAPNFPTITIGQKGGIDVALSSWDSAMKPFDVAISADKLLAKRIARKVPVTSPVVPNVFSDVPVYAEKTVSRGQHARIGTGQSID